MGQKQIIGQELAFNLSGSLEKSFRVPLYACAQ